MFYLLFVAFSIFGFAEALRFEDVEEGSCIPSLEPVANTNLNFLVSTMKYIPALSRYYMYRTAAGHPGFRQMREFEIYYKMCTTLNISASTGLVQVCGLGGHVLTSQNMTFRANQPGVIDAILVNKNGEKNVQVTKTVTLTDHNSFAFIVSCWHDVNLKSWDVVSVNKELSTFVQRMIEQHALSLGFKAEQSVFLSYSNCEEESKE